MSALLARIVVNPVAQAATLRERAQRAVAYSIKYSPGSPERTRAAENLAAAEAALVAALDADDERTRQLADLKSALDSHEANWQRYRDHLTAVAEALGQPTGGDYTDLPDAAAARTAELDQLRGWLDLRTSELASANEQRDDARREVDRLRAELGDIHLGVVLDTDDRDATERRLAALIARMEG